MSSQVAGHRSVGGARGDAERFAYATLDALTDHVAVLDEQGTIVVVNRAWREFAGANSASPEGLSEGANYFSACERATGEDRAHAEHFAAGLRSVIGGEADEFSVEYPCHAATRRRWFVARATRFEFEGEVRAVVAHTDITARKLAEEATRFQLHLLDTVEQAVIATDLGGVITYWNSFAEKLYGWRAVEAVGRTIVEVALPEGAHERASEIMSSLRAGQNWSGELTVRRRDGTTFQAFITDTPIHDEESKLIGIVGVSTDITERKRAEERLRESEERYRAIVNQATVGVAHGDLSGNLTIVNQKYCEITGYTEAELLAMRMHDITHPDDLPPNVEQFRRLVSEGAPLETEKRYVRKDGSIIWVGVGASAILDREGRPQSTVAVVLDITERKRAEKLLDAQKQTLEMVVAGAPLAEVLTHLTRVVEQQADGRAVASILLLDAQGRLHNGASPSLPDDYLKAIDGIKADPEVGTCSAAAALGRVVVTADIETDLRWRGLKHLPLGLGFRAAWSMPIVARDGSVLGTFGTYFRERREPEPLERSAVEILSRTAALVIERARAEDALRESEEWLRAIFDASRDGILVEDDERIVYVNSAYARLFGYETADTLTGRHISEVISEADRERLLEYGRRRVRGEAAPTVYEFKGRRKDGGPVDLEASVSISKVGGKAYITTMIRDIAERKRAEEALRESVSKYRLLMEQASDGIHTYDLQGNFIEVNPKLCEMLGYTREELLRLNVKDLIPSEDLASSPIRFDELAAGRTVLSERLLRRRDGTLLPVEISGRMIEGGVLQSIVRDISERKAAEEELRKAYDEMEGRVEERTAALARANETLKDEIAERRRAEEGRRELLRRLVTAQEDERRRISRELHDQMGQRLTALMMGLKALDADSYGRPATLSGLQRLQHLTDELSSEAHTLAWGLRPPALDDLGLHAALYNYVEEWAERSRVLVDFHSFGVEGVRLPLTHETALYRIIQEALTNVSKHSGADRVSIILERRGETVVAVIEDNGCGFDAEAAAGASGREPKLGLMGMRERAELLGGTLSVESTPGAGTSVFVRIPAGAQGGEGGAAHE